jgi:2-keto-4-pentenoate hydratase/2-oxohepta-3-ene-1,7-dioic acid hydratase in catechol pathway
MGLVLASDYTDRAALLRHIDLGDVASGTGFSLAKGEPAFMPVGNLFVIPKDLARFVATLSLELWLDGALRQRAQPARLTWPVERIVDESFLRADRRWQAAGREVALPIVDGRIPARTLILSGTPDGVLFQGLSARQRFVGASELVAGMHGGWRVQTVVEPYIRESLAAERFLQPGATVTMRADRLGVIVNRIGRSSGPLP